MTIKAFMTRTAVPIAKTPEQAKPRNSFARSHRLALGTARAWRYQGD